LPGNFALELRDPGTDVIAGEAGPGWVWLTQGGRWCENPGWRVLGSAAGRSLAWAALAGALGVVG